MKISKSNEENKTIMMLLLSGTSTFILSFRSYIPQYSLLPFFDKFMIACPPFWVVCYCVLKVNCHCRKRNGKSSITRLFLIWLNNVSFYFTFSNSSFLRQITAYYFGKSLAHGFHSNFYILLAFRISFLTVHAISNGKRKQQNMAKM